MFNVGIFAIATRETIFALARGSMVVFVTVLARATILAVNVSALARLYLAVVALVAFGTFAVSVRIVVVSAFACAIVATVGEARTFLVLAVFASVVIYANACEMRILLVAVLAFAAMLARIIMFGAVLVFTARAMEAELALTLGLMIFLSAIYALAMVLAFVWSTQM